MALSVSLSTLAARPLNPPLPFASPPAHQLPHTTIAIDPKYTTHHPAPSSKHGTRLQVSSLQVESLPDSSSHPLSLSRLPHGHSTSARQTLHANTCACIHLASSIHPANTLTHHPISLSQTWDQSTVCFATTANAPDPHSLPARMRRQARPARAGVRWATSARASGPPTHPVTVKRSTHSR